MLHISAGIKGCNFYGFRLGDAALPAQTAACAKLLIDQRLVHVQHERIGYRATADTGAAFRAAVGQAGLFIN